MGQGLRAIGRAGRKSSSTISGKRQQLYRRGIPSLVAPGLVAVSERMNPFHSSLERPNESPLPLLPAGLSAQPLSSSTTGLQPACMPEPTPFRLSSAEDRFRSGVSASLLGQSAEVAQDAPGLLEEISPGPPPAGGTKSPETALAQPKTAAVKSCKQHLGSLPNAWC